MGFQAPNHTQIPNDFLDNMLPKLTDTEVRVLLVVMRKTLGWHKYRDRISLTQLEKLTGKNRQAILKACKHLEELSILSKTVTGLKGQQETTYELIVLEEGDQCDNHTPPSVINIPPPSVIITPTKENLSKEKHKEKEIYKEKDNLKPIQKEEIKFGDHVHLTQDEYEKLCAKEGKPQVDLMIEKMNNHLTAHGKKPYKDYAAALRVWFQKQKEDFKPNQQAIKDKKQRDIDGNDLNSHLDKVF